MICGGIWQALGILPAMKKLFLICLLAATAAQAATPVEVVVGGTAFRNTAGEKVWQEFQRKAEAAAQGGLRLMRRARRPS